ncbi:unnamed protein product [Chondrus crispus]|uniref:Chromo domain-containing protein n=1 Tax=Chondrus crispus TaxID=2769 RepID=R7QC01_CHOCR|nr:unnamed protein product [Chondrus crispus]CDF35328.1 unnamed protein product [Chondrus crispus]|eukprot:XP_005715147.1 unnamed protein product [Chondrus crispus]
MQLLEINKLQNDFDNMHRDVERRVSSNRAKQIQHHNNNTNIISTIFCVGDFVLVRRAQNKGHKQSFRWIGPRSVAKVVSEIVYAVENLVTHQVEQVHAARMILSRAKMDGKKVSAKLMKHAEHSEARFEMIEKLMDVTGTRKEGIWIQVQWLGLPDRRDWTWQPLKELFEDCDARSMARFTVIASLSTLCRDGSDP